MPARPALPGMLEREERSPLRADPAKRESLVRIRSPDLAALLPTKQRLRWPRWRPLRGFVLEPLSRVKSFLEPSRQLIAINQLCGTRVDGA